MCPLRRWRAHMPTGRRRSARSSRMPLRRTERGSTNTMRASTGAEGGSRLRVGEILTIERHDDAIPTGVFTPGDVDVEVDRTHDPIAEILVDRFFDRGTVHGEGLEEA